MSVKENKETYVSYSRISNPLKKFRFIVIFISATFLLPYQQAESKQLFLKCTGKFEINRGALIKPDWETSYLSINLDGSKSTLIDKGIKTEGRTLIRRNSYTITTREKSNRIKSIYKIDATHFIYTVNYAKRKRTLIGTCQKSRG